MQLTNGEIEIFRKKPHIRVSAWAEQNVIVPDGPYSGARFRSNVNPYLAGIMDTWGAGATEEVIVCGSPQTGKTLLMNSCIAYGQWKTPCPAMLAMPDDNTLDRSVELKLDPMFRKTKQISELYGKRKSSRLTLKNGGVIHFASAASPSQRASISIRHLFLDEEPLYRMYSGQGDPVTDFRERTRSYPTTKKILRIAKPLGDDTCSIVADLDVMDEVRDYHVPCIACGTFQLLEPENVTTEADVKDPAKIEREKLGRYRCPHCGFYWTDYSRDQAVARGEWRAAEPVAHPRRVGFHLPAILSAAVSISEIAAAKIRLEQTDDADKHQAYANGLWARPYRPVVVSTREDEVLELVDKDLPPRTLPRGYIAVTSFIDMQKRGFYYMVCAWTAKLDCAVLDYGRLADWAEVYDHVFRTTYEAEDGGEPATIWRAGIDTGGTRSELDSKFVTRSEECYSFVSKHGSNVLFATKGASRKLTNPVQWSVRERMPQSKAVIHGGLRLYLIDTYHFKSWASGRMNVAAHQPLRLHAECGEDLAKQLTAEELVRERGRQVWKIKRRDNHWFDCLCGNHALIHQSWTPSLAKLAGDLGIDDGENYDDEFEDVGIASPPPPAPPSPSVTQSNSSRKKMGGSLW